MSLLDIFKTKPAKSETVSSSTQGPEKWYADAGKDLWGKAQTIGNKPFEAYDPRQRVAELGPDYQTGFDLTRASTGTWKPGMDTATGVATTMATDRGFLDAPIEDYMNPYDAIVTEAGAKRLGEERDIGMSKLLSRMRGGGANLRNDARAGLVTSDFVNKANEGIGDYIAKSGAASYDKATQLWGADRASRAQAATMLANLAQQGQTMNLKDVQALYEAAGYQRLEAQQLADATYQEFLRKIGYDADQLDQLYSWLGQTPHATTGSGNQTTTTKPGGNLALQLAGLGLAGASFLFPPAGAAAGVAKTVGGGTAP